MKRVLTLFTAALLGAALFAGGISVHALAGHQPNSVLSITGCVTGTGKLVKVKVGDVPKQPCGGATEVHLSGGDITAVLPAAGGGLTGGGSNGETALGLGDGYKLPQGCAPDNVPKSFGAGKWICGVAALGDQACPAGAIVTGLDAAGKLVCGRSIVSANGLSRIEVDDTSVRVEGRLVDIQALEGAVFTGGSLATQIGSSRSPTFVLGQTLMLNGTSCPQLARKGDAVVVNPQNGVGSVVTGSPTVFAC